MQSYLWIKSAHIVLVMAWVAAAFFLPRILINIVEDGGDGPVRQRLLLMGRRLYRFGHVMFGLAVVAGLVLWLGYRVIPDFPTMVGSGTGWLHAKLLLVAVMFALYIVDGRQLKGVARGGGLPSTKALRIRNELPVLILLVIVWLVLAKPF
ncbi:membrane protein [Luteimonas padinae]|uniref:Protoporphyrinogen IX oxidase n=1 Tax=Luteimonas padinae TaxID=1714359 RepID=A0ABV6SS19_9GAMM|nr:CopD family protein [Luteimonas padinae]GHD64613.1 membrane protein [Luteimonas padinae]